jgi:outer membrane protein
MKRITQISLLAAALAACGLAQAQSAGSFSARLGATQISPDVKSGNLTAPSLPNTTADVKSASQVTGGVTYMLSDNIAIDVPLGIPFKHDLVGTGSIQGVGKIGDVQALPASVFAQYRFGAANAGLRPYLGIGATYAYFSKARGSGALTGLTNPGGAPTRVKVDSKFTVSFQGGLVAAINDKWFVDANLVYTPLKTTTKLSTGQSLVAELNPTAFSVGVGMKF